ncbi:pre-B-cell leukemia transcription factor-interacting protein 1 isoform X1 [Poecilia latipinna]|uniref:Pre-B-cell leukemia homeobox interacting protein 1a n=1 Tax=Poecilia latipinna TaxID=48699 RepID=A0A3B3UG82_9TELE|nr:PREDICTED: pre-B-cell leukemia transcription factor-interacting protein 1-like isoform X1 [Poecilia latipinna]XP_014903402.1 PREDICTED: pre-B-cell leukemia transcription factor-interacting protein 1-like isoform X1 [Poecilia latipinna]XP_014903404.1 PREDICTED: pre-B-cell leukemia transcription factor-interacting protein 1-like isoform X1 [Poecilia latipinna]
MSDSSNSTGSTGSSTNSWTLLSPEEAAIENVGPADDGTESLGDAPSLSEEVAGAAAEEKPAELPVETILSEEGHQVCQETSPESGEGPIPSSPSRLSPPPSSPLEALYIDTESQPPVIHDIVTTSPSDNEPQGAMPLVGSMDLAAQLDIPADVLLADPAVSPPHTTDASAEAALHTPADSEPTPASAVARSDVWSSEPEVTVPTETLTAAEPPPHVEAEVSFAAEPPSPVPERPKTRGSPDPETVGSAEAEEGVADAEREEEMPSESQNMDEEEEEDQSSSIETGEVNGFDDGLRRRNVPSFEAPRPRTSDEEDDEEEVEFKMAERQEDKPWFSINKCVVAALVLLFLGSLFLSGDIDSPDLTDRDIVKDQKQGCIYSDPQKMKGMLDEMREQITHLETRIQIRTEQLNSEMQAMAESDDELDRAGLEEKTLNLKEELATLLQLSRELESLRDRVNKYNQSAGKASSAPASSSESDAEDAQSSQTAAGPEREQDEQLEEDLHCQKDLLDDIKKRLGGMKKDAGDGKQVWENLDGIQEQLSKHVESWEKTKPHGPKWKGKKEKKQERDHWKKEEKKDKEWKHSKEEKKEKENSHKESWRKHQDEWQRRKSERRMDREERRKEKPWHSRPGENSHQPRQPHHHHQHHHNDFWRDQELKLHRNVRPQLGCSSLEDCASKEGLYPVELAEFEELLEGYLSKLEGSPSESKDELRKVTADFFEDGVFIHDRVRFGDFAEDVADVLEDMVDVMEGSDSLEEEMEEFEREALWKFAATA